MVDRLGKVQKKRQVAYGMTSDFFAAASELNILLMPFIMQQVTSLIHLKNSFSS